VDCEFSRLRGGLFDLTPQDLVELGRFVLATIPSTANNVVDCATLRVMSVPNLLNVTFRVTTYSKEHPRSRKGFSFPQELSRAFGFGRPHAKDRVALMITTLSGQTPFCGISNFISGSNEITEAKPCRNLDFAQEIRVTASRAPSD